MSLESASFISGLDATNPTSSDQIKQGDDHLRLIKTVLQACFPNADKAFYFPDSATKTGNYSILAADMSKVFLCDATGGAFNMTLPTLASGDDGWGCWLIKIDSSTSAITIVGTVNGAANPTISRQYVAQRVFWSGTAWYTVGANADPAVLVSKDAGATLGPQLDLFRDSASPAASDFIGSLDFNGRDSVANKQLYARLGAQITDPTSTSEDAILLLQQVIAGTLTTILTTTATALSTVLQLLGQDGTKTLPAFSFSADPDTGLYRIGANNLGVSCGDTKIVDISTTTVAVTGDLSATQTLSAGGAGGAMVATQAEQETATATDRLVSPGRQHSHPSAAKAWGVFNGATGTMSPSFNITGNATRNSTGNYTVTIATDFSSSAYVIVATANGGGNLFCHITSRAAGSFVLQVVSDGAAAADPTTVMFACFGDQ